MNHIYHPRYVAKHAPVSFKNGTGASLTPQSLKMFFYHNFKTNKVKCINVYIFRKEILQGIHLFHQIQILRTRFIETHQKCVILSQVFITSIEIC